MSLDIYLEGKTREVGCECPNCYNEHKREESETFYSANITHNLIPMAKEAGIYEMVWRPEENEIKKASQLIEPLKKAINEMTADAPRFEAHNSENGWGLYKHFFPWLKELLTACENYPNAIPRASR